MLCHLIDESQMDIYDVNINEITDQYIEYLRAMEELDLEITSDNYETGYITTYIQIED